MTAVLPATTRVRGAWCRHVPAPGGPADPFHRGPADSDGRWQLASVCGGFYLADEEPTAWAEWYRFLAAAGLEPAAGLPRQMLRYDLDVEVADLRGYDRLADAGLAPPSPDGDWSPYQRVGSALHAAGFAGLVTSSAARPDNTVVCLFRGAGVRAPAGVAFLPPPRVVVSAPAVPRGLRT